ncbi:hypothetical protein GA549_07715 [Bifidobacterium adolescentis]|uniref:Uncharacterized protein n=1 Tax=Bifidobacterium adolescentis TaxID=1680 RepID=A0A6I0VBU7_BIFAD|nr:hypothetical protein [Bifidobacterium adolescentis]KAB5967231.1 hypothetical protein GA599_09180 [Bifidobacterium adolescentis]KAB5969054.1 hypothetical protein GA578_08670 [Bifidobacterium adolescentis]KAB5972925.1 hypothetical protein GA577_07665 [Bifidobacterium adolescentis]KAB5974526.1 hypothetical protein GA576_07695 [Bifidobacterium adolescentis]KAB5976726.1 hypothetical protein GA569_04125 [Bifidobacterium adolescentis]
MMKDLIGLCCGCLMGVVVPLLFCRLAKHWNVLSDIAAGEILAYTSEVIPFCFCLFDFAYGLFNWLIFGSFRFLDIKIPTMALRVCAGGFLAILPAAALIVRVFPEVRSPEGVWQGFLLLGLLPLAVILARLGQWIPAVFAFLGFCAVFYVMEIACPLVVESTSTGANGIRRGPLA